MASKLFKAVVGLGISFGTASVACLGSGDSATEPTESEASAPSSPAGEASAPSTDSGSDASADAPADAPRDVLMDAFCDASWPTTKGNSGPTCGSIEECHDSGPAPFCYKTVDGGTHTCDSTTSPLPAWCVGGAWQCSESAVPVTECKCWVNQACQ